MIDWPQNWGHSVSEKPCEHLLALRDYLELRGLCVWSEHGEPDAWVNVFCGQCQKTYEVSFRQIIETKS